ncbi:xylitol oxidase [Arthrobacter sp. CAN_A214]|uniref:FAD-binding protein n=1 Tax=Arthrobacter sp. CAN_A214 TaxID=2787720 RepID=UPI001A258B0F
MSTELNWAGNHTYRADRLAYPRSTAELQELVASAPKLRALGSRHSFNDLADSTGTLVSLEKLDPGISIDETARTVSVSGGTRYGVLAEELQRRGYALHNLASLPHISVAGAVATATHGSGDANGNLATAVVGMDLVLASGEIRSVRRSSTADFDGMVVGLGALGIVSRLILRIEPAFGVRQDVFTDIPWATVLEDFDAATSAAYSVSLFTDWRSDVVSQAWLKSRTDAPGLTTRFFGGTPARAALHPLPGISAENCTVQLGVPGPWSDRLAHFRMEFFPSSGQELQTEYLVPREYAVEAITVMRSFGKRLGPLLQVSEIRSMAADRLWLSSSYERASIGLHLTWKPEQAAVEALLPELEAALAPLSARPHWGKLFAAEVEALEPLYPRFSDFRELAERMDPEHKFRNDFLERKVFGRASRPGALDSPAVSASGRATASVPGSGAG